MKWTPYVLAPVVAAIVIPGARATTYLDVAGAQQAIFPGRRFQAVEEGRLWKAPDGSLLIVEKVVGKHEWITIAIGIGPDGAVRGIEIMQYNESYGYEVREASWRRQFVGKTAGSPLTLGVDIKNISGATLSCKHITDAVKRVLESQ